MGLLSGGNTPAAPDLSGNTAAANQTFGTATSNAGQTYNTALAYNQNAQNSLAQATGMTNQMSNAVANNANANLGQYQNTFMPLQQQQVDQAKQWGSDANIARMQGQAVANTNAGVQAANNNAKMQLASSGMDPNSIAGIARANNIQGAAAAAGAGTQAGINTQMQAQQLTNQANQLGMQVGAQGMAGAGQAAQTAAMGQGLVNQTNASSINNMTAANQYLNTGINANSSAANIQSQQFQNQMAQYQAQQAQSAGVGQLMGNVGGIAAMALMAEGGPVPQPSSGIPIFNHATNYAAGGQVMQQGALPSSPIPGSTDTKPALLTPGEFVMPKDVVDFVGQDHFHKMIDSIRNKANQRRALPIHHPPHVTRQ